MACTPLPQRLPEYAAFRCSVPDRLIEELNPAILPETWRGYPAPPQLQQIGSEWVTNLRSVALAVPSAVIESETNLLLNPDHPDFAKFLVSCGIDSVSFNPDALVRGIQNITEAELVQLTTAENE